MYKYLSYILIAKIENTLCIIRTEKQTMLVYSIEDFIYYKREEALIFICMMRRLIHCE